MDGSGKTASGNEGDGTRPAAPDEAVPDGFRLIPGMKVRAEIKVGTRSVISYFLYPVIRALDEGLREP